MKTTIWYLMENLDKAQDGRTKMNRWETPQVVGGSHFYECFSWRSKNSKHNLIVDTGSIGVEIQSRQGDGKMIQEQVLKACIHIS